MTEQTPPRTPVLEHLLELRSRLLVCLGVFLLGFLVSYYFVEDIYQYLMQPLADAFEHPEQRRLIYTGLHEAFFTYIKLSFFTSALITLPIASIQLWRFMAPGLYRHERKHIAPAFLVTPVLFVAGASLAFYVIIPMAWRFFLGFETSGQDGALAVALEARVSEYLSLVMQLVLAFGVSFELPVVLFILAKMGMVTAESLRQHRKYVVVLVFLVAAFITPPDLISQIALGVPVLLLYELTILVIQWTQADEQGLHKEAAAAAAFR